jgi:hypothetical protein
MRGYLYMIHLDFIASPHTDIIHYRTSNRNDTRPIS